MASASGAKSTNQAEMPLGLVAAEDALRFELPESGSLAQTRSILDRVALDLDLAEAGVSDLDAEEQSAALVRIATARTKLDGQRHVVALKETMEDLGSAFGDRTLVHWVTHGPDPRHGPALLYVDTLGTEASKPWNLLHLVDVVRDHLHLTPNYVNLPEAPHLPKPAIARTAGRHADAIWSAKGVCVFVRIDSAVDMRFSGVILSRELERFHQVRSSRCIVLDTHFDPVISNMVLHNNGLYQGGAGTWDELAFLNLTKMAFDLVRPLAVEYRDAPEEVL